MSYVQHENEPVWRKRRFTNIDFIQLKLYSLYIEGRPTGFPFEPTRGNSDEHCLARRPEPHQGPHSAGAGGQQHSSQDELEGLREAGDERRGVLSSPASRVPSK